MHTGRCSKSKSILFASLHHLPPKYPLHKYNRDGSVTVQFVIDVQGVPQNVRVLDAAPHGIFEQTAVAAVKRWRYQPMRVYGRPASVPVTRTIRFARPQPQWTAGG